MAALASAQRAGGSTRTAAVGKRRCCPVAAPLCRATSAAAAPRQHISAPDTASSSGTSSPSISNGAKAWWSAAAAAVAVCSCAAAPPAAWAGAPESFAMKCAGCHMAGGNVLQPGATLFTEDLQRNGRATPEALYEIIYGGKGKMPGFGADCAPRGACTFGPRFTDEEVREMADYVSAQAAGGWKAPAPSAGAP